MDLRVELGRRPALLGGPPPRPADDPPRAPVRRRPRRAPRGASAAAPRRVRTSTRRGPAADGPAGLEAALDRLAARGAWPPRAAGAELVVLTDRGCVARPAADPVDPRRRRGPRRADRGRPARPDGPRRRGGRRPRRPRRWRWSSRSARPAVVPVARDRARGRAGRDARRRGARRRPTTVGNLLAAFEAGLRKTLARMGISTVASYIGGAAVRDDRARRRRSSRAASRRRRRGPAGSASPTSPSASSAAATAALAIADRRRPRASSRTRASPASAPTARSHLYAPRIVGRDPGASRLARPRAPTRRTPTPRSPLPRGARPAARDASSATSSAVRRPRGRADPARRGRGRPLDRAPLRRLRRCSVGALSPEAHQALTIGIQRAGGAANTGEGGEDPALVRAGPGRRAPRRPDQAGRLGPVRRHRRPTSPAPSSSRSRSPRARSPARAASCPAQKATAYIAALRRGQPGQSYISPPPHHDIYSIEDLAQLIADLRAINPTRPDRRQARRGARRRHDRGRRRQGRRDVRPPVRPRRRDRAPRRCRRSSTSARRGSSAWPRSTRSCSATACATASRCAPTAGCRPAATCWSRRSSAPRSSRSGRRRSSRSAATWPASATSTPARPASPPSARTCGPSSPGTPEQVVALLHRDRRGPPARAGGGRRPRRSARSSARAGGCLRADRRARDARSRRRSSAPRRGRRLAGPPRRTRRRAGRDIGHGAASRARAPARRGVPRPGLGHAPTGLRAARPPTARSGPG